MNIQKFTTDFFESNVYLFEVNSNKIMVDCGGTPNWISQLLKDREFHPDYLLLTHGHIDHILGLPHFTETDTKVFIHQKDAHYLLDPEYNLSTRLIGTAFIWDHNFYDYSDLPDELGIKVISTPGHTPGSISLQIDGHLLTGDTLFCGGIGNTAFPGGDYITEVQSIKKLLELSPHLSVHPGHGGSTTIGDEKNTI